MFYNCMKFENISFFSLCLFKVLGGKGPSRKFEIGPNKLGFRPNSVPVNRSTRKKRTKIKTNRKYKMENYENIKSCQTKPVLSQILWFGWCGWWKPRMIMSGKPKSPHLICSHFAKSFPGQIFGASHLILNVYILLKPILVRVLEIYVSPNMFTFC